MARPPPTVTEFRPPPPLVTDSEGNRSLVVPAHVGALQVTGTGRDPRQSPNTIKLAIGDSAMLAIDSV